MSKVDAKNWIAPIFEDTLRKDEIPFDFRAKEAYIHVLANVSLLIGLGGRTAYVGIALLSWKEEPVLVRSGRSFSVILLTVFALALTASSVGAQILYGSITGVAKDAQGAAVPGATVTIVNKETNLTRDTVTGGD
jgi:ABC-type arginine/histidine transport system permease subunit